jgi:hypothetical protein
LHFVTEAHAPCLGAGRLAVTLEPYIVAAAFRIADGRVFALPPPARHPHVRDFVASLGIDPLRAEQGFVTNYKGEFLDREHAWALICESGQPLLPGRVCSATKRAIPDDELLGSILTSEDLW